MPAVINIIDAIPLSARDRESVFHHLEESFGLPARLCPIPNDIQRAYDSGRNQFNSTALLTQLLELGLSSEEKVIALVGVDLFIPILTFVFGEAQLDGQAAIVSIHRLANQFYGMEEDSILRRERLAKEIIHEAGHTFGLRHCRQFECVMRSSTYVEEIDVKRMELCSECRVLFQQSVKSLDHSQR